MLQVASVEAFAAYVCVFDGEPACVQSHDFIMCLDVVPELCPYVVGVGRVFETPASLV